MKNKFPASGRLLFQIKMIFPAWDNRFRRKKTPVPCRDSYFCDKKWSSHHGTAIFVTENDCPIMGRQLFLSKCNILFTGLSFFLSGDKYRGFILVKKIFFIVRKHVLLFFGGWAKFFPHPPLWTPLCRYLFVGIVTAFFYPSLGISRLLGKIDLCELKGI